MGHRLRKNKKALYRLVFHNNDIQVLRVFSTRSLLTNNYSNYGCLGCRPPKKPWFKRKYSI
jgi:hypothetical protein